MYLSCTSARAGKTFPNEQALLAKKPLFPKNALKKIDKFYKCLKLTLIIKWNSFVILKLSSFVYLQQLPFS